MPISVSIPLRRLTQAEFGAISYTVMEHVFAIHKEFGRFFDERIYKRELARRVTGVTLEVPVDVAFQSFAKRYFLDVIVGEGALFEFKCAQDIHPRHRAQLLHYLMLAELRHGKLINMRTEAVQHEFVNTTLCMPERCQFQVDASRWQPRSEGAAAFETLIVALVRELGAGLDIALYEEALAYLLGSAGVPHEVAVASDDGSPLGGQPMRLITADSAFKLTSFKTYQPGCAEHFHRLLLHTPLRTIQWANITHGLLTLTTVSKVLS